MRAVAVVLLGLCTTLAGCNQVFGLDEGTGGDGDGGRDATDLDGAGDDGDGGPDASDEPICADADVIFCARFATGLTDDGFRNPPTTTAGGSIVWVDEGSRFIRSHIADSGFPQQGTIDATLSMGGPLSYRVTFLARSSPGCGLDAQSGGVPVDLFRLAFPVSGISAFIRHRGPGLDVGIDAPGGPVYGSVQADLTGALHRFDLTVDFPGNKLALHVDDTIETNTGFDVEPLGGSLSSIVVGARGEGNQVECQIEYDDIVVHVRQP